MNFKKMPLWVGLLVGLAVIGVGVFVLFDGQKTADWPTVEAVVRDVDSRADYDANNNRVTTHDYVLTYTVDGTEYTTRSNSDTYPRVGSTKTLAYNPDNPSDNRVGGSNGWFGWVLIAGGVLIMVMSVVLMVANRVVPANQPPQPPQPPLQ